MKIAAPLAKTILLSSVLITAASAADVAILKRILGSVDPRTYCSGFKYPSDLAERTVRTIISNKEMEDTVKIVKYFEGSGLLIKCINQTIENKRRGGFWLGTLRAISLGNMLTGKGFIRAGERATKQGRVVIRAAEGTTGVRTTAKSRRRRQDF